MLLFLCFLDAGQHFLSLQSSIIFIIYCTSTYFNHLNYSWSCSSSRSQTFWTLKWKPDSKGWDTKDSDGLWSILWPGSFMAILSSQHFYDGNTCLNIRVLAIRFGTRIRIRFEYMALGCIRKKWWAVGPWVFVLCRSSWVKDNGKKRFVCCSALSILRLDMGIWSFSWYPSHCKSTRIDFVLLNFRFHFVVLEVFEKTRWAFDIGVLTSSIGKLEWIL